jgi:hypothetical protein
MSTRKNGEAMGADCFHGLFLCRSGQHIVDADVALLSKNRSDHSAIDTQRCSVSG